jgi:MFS family permease
MSDHIQPAAERAAHGRSERYATRVAFFIGGFDCAVWAPIIPFVKQRLGLDDGSLGLLILCFGLGSLATMALSGWAAERFGCRAVLRLGSLLAAASLPLLATLRTVPGMVATLLVFGSAVGAIDVVVNIQGVIVEKASGRPLMSGFHAGWSIGGFAGAALMTGMLSLGAAPWMAAVLALVLMAALHFGFSKGLLSAAGAASEKRRLALPPLFVLAVGALMFIGFLSEGSVLDWGAVFLSSNKGVPIAMAGSGYMALSIVMVACRVAGDIIVRKLGGVRVLLLGGLIGAAGFTIVILAAPLWLMLIGFGLIGLGLSNVVPVLFSLCGKQTRMPANQAVSVASTLAYTGVLLGPAIIGGISKASSLSIGLGVVTLLVLVVAASSPIARR